jgi:hypothetical protein
MAAFLSLSALGKALSPTSLPNAEPTDCIKTVLLSCKSQLEHSQTQLPEDAIKIVSQGGATVKFVVTQWEDSYVEMIAIRYHKSHDAQDFIMTEDVKGGSCFSYL